MKLTENQKLLVRGLRAFRLPEDEQIAIFLFCNTEEKIFQFNQWVKSRLDGEKLMATETEICRAAVQIAKKHDCPTDEIILSGEMPSKKIT